MPNLNIDSSTANFREFQNQVQHPMYVLGIKSPSANSSAMSIPREPIPVFDGLCQTLTTGVSELEASVEDLMNWKDEFSRQSVPSSVKLDITILFSRLFRSKSELHAPIFELIRQVDTYARQWNVKRMKLLELEKDYHRFFVANKPLLCAGCCNP